MFLLIQIANQDKIKNTSPCGPITWHGVSPSVNLKAFHGGVLTWERAVRPENHGSLKRKSAFPEGQ